MANTSCYSMEDVVGLRWLKQGEDDECCHPAAIISRRNKWKNASFRLFLLLLNGLLSGDMVVAWTNHHLSSGHQRSRTIRPVVVSSMNRNSNHGLKPMPTLSFLDGKEKNFVWNNHFFVLKGNNHDLAPDQQEPQQQERTVITPSGRGSLARCFMTVCLCALLTLLPVAPGGASVESADSDPTMTMAPETTIRSSRLPSSSYWTSQTSVDSSAEDRIAANAALLEHAVRTINTLYYDPTGGAFFQPREFYQIYRTWLHQQDSLVSSPSSSAAASSHILASRDGAVRSLKWLVSDVLHDPYSQYLTREELRNELSLVSVNEGFLGLGAMVNASPPAEPPPFTTLQHEQQLQQQRQQASLQPLSVVSNLVQLSRSGGVPYFGNGGINGLSKAAELLTREQAESLPAITAVTPNSPAERAGLVVGDRIVSVGADSFVGLAPNAVMSKLQQKYSAENYLGHPYLTVAKPVLSYAYYQYNARSSRSNTFYNDASVILAASYSNAAGDGANAEEGSYLRRDIIRGYRPTHVRLPTVAAEPFTISFSDSNSEPRRIAGGDAVIQYELLTAQNSIFDRFSFADTRSSSRSVGYIRLTRFSRASTIGFVKAVKALEAAGASSFIIDLRNNYGGVIQEAMLTASTLLRDPHLVLCYTMNSRGGFTPHDVEEYVVDSRYPGYLLSREPKTATLNQVKRESPKLFQEDGWSPMSSYASLHEQQVKRGLHRPGSVGNFGPASPSWNFIGLSSDVSGTTHLQQLSAQNNLVLLINEGTASSAEVFASALHDNGRTVALVGSRTFGKGLVQHTFPMPDGGGLRLTVAEYLTPLLHHVTHVGGAQFDRQTGEWIGGGISPDIECDSKQGIPSNIGADLCVGMALDALNEVADDSSNTLLFQKASGQYQQKLFSLQQLGGVSTMTANIEDL